MVITLKLRENGVLTNVGVEVADNATVEESDLRRQQSKPASLIEQQRRFSGGTASTGHGSRK
jgi:hypothetical protein